MKEIKIILDNFEFLKKIFFVFVGESPREREYIHFKFFIKLRGKKCEKIKIKDEINKFLKMSQNLFNFYNWFQVNYSKHMISVSIASYEFDVNYFFYVNLIKNFFEKIFGDELKLNLVFRRKIINLIKHLKKLKNNNDKLEKEFDIQFSVYRFGHEKNSNYFLIYCNLDTVNRPLEVYPFDRLYFANGIIDIYSKYGTHNFFIENEEVSSIVETDDSRNLYFYFKNVDKFIEKFGEEKFKEKVVEHIRDYLKDLFFKFFDASCRFFDIR